MAADVSARVHLVAEKLQQKAQDAQRKGNDNAACALSASVSDLRQALALIAEQRHLLARRKGEGDDEEDDADAHVQAIAARLLRVETILVKKADDMKAKGNENAATALQQSAAAVDTGRVLLLEQQQTIFGLVGRWEKLQSIARSDEKRSRYDRDGCHDGDETQEQETREQRKLVARVRYLVQVDDVIADVFPDCHQVNEVRHEVEKLKLGLKLAREEAEAANEMLKQKCLAFDTVNMEMERVKEREAVRQEEDAALLEQQRDACQAMEQLVRESDQEIHRLVHSAVTRDEELQSLRIEMESLAAEKERLIEVHGDEIEGLQGQLASAMDALSMKMDEEEKLKTEEAQILQTQLDSVTLEKNSLDKAHADEVEELRRQLEDAAASLSATKTETADANTEELQALLAMVDALTAEKESLIKLHGNEVKKLQETHLHEVEDLHRKLGDAVSDVSTKTEANGERGVEEVQAVQAKTFDKEDLAKAYADKVGALQKAHRDEIGDLRRQLESAASSFSANVEKIEAQNAEKLQSLRGDVHNLSLEKGELAESYDKEVQKLREVYLAEIEDLRNQLEATTADDAARTKERTESTADELQQMRAEVGLLVVEKDRLVKEHAVEIDKLLHQVKGARAGETSTSGDEQEFSLDENEYDGEHVENDNIPVMELDDDEVRLVDIADEDSVDTSSDGASDSKNALEMQAARGVIPAHVARYDEHSQTQQNSISELEQKQAELMKEIETVTNGNTQTNEMQRANGADVLSNQAGFNVLQARVGECENSCQAQQKASSTSRKEQALSQEQMELVANEKANVVSESRRPHGEEATCLTERLADSESVDKSFVTQLNEMKSELAAKSAEQKEAVKALMLCKSDLYACRSELDAQILECSRLESELEVVQHTEAAKSEEIDQRLSKLTTELCEVVMVLRSSSKVDADAMSDFTSKAWHSPEVTELCSGLAPLLTDLISAQDQIHTIEEQLELMRSERDNKTLIVDQFVRAFDYRLFAKDGEKVDEVTEALDKDVYEHLSVAKINIHRWLDESQLLRDGVEKDLIKLNALEQEKLQYQKQLAALEASEHDLQVLVESLNEELIMTRTKNQEAVKSVEMLKAQNDSASIQEQQQQVAQQKEVAELQQNLIAMRSDFDRYRARSHTALKKMEKRAELLNGMRKENEELFKQIKESDRQRDQAVAAREDSECRLQEAQCTQEMMQAEFDQCMMEKLRVIAKLEDEGERLASEKEQMGVRIQELAIKVQEIETEKKQIEVESERLKKTEQAAFQARLDTATAAVQTAKLDLQTAHDALEVSKAENDKRQRLIESLELKLETQSHTAMTIDTTTKFPVEANIVIPAPVTYVSPLASPAVEEKNNVASLVKEVSVLRASDTLLRKQLNDAQAELFALQERFATTKAANAEKVFALEEKSNHWRMELAVVTEEVQRLNTIVEAQKKMAPHSPTNGTTLSTIDQTQEVETTAELLAQVQGRTAELADANTEITLLTRMLDGCREELQDAQNQLDQLAPLSSELESNEDSSAVSKATKALAAREEALKKMRIQVVEMQEEMQMLREEKTALESKLEKGELDELQASRKHMQSEKARAMQVQRRKTVLSGFKKQVVTIVNELQQRLEEHSSAFREVCDFRDTHYAFLFSDEDGGHGNTLHAAEHAGDPEFEECLVMRSGVVIKAGASFRLPVFCEKSGWHVVWSFSVKEDGADVSFKLSAMMEDAKSTNTEVVSPERMNEMSGVFSVRHDNTTLVFEWDNSFSWLNEKTLDYHVSIQEPLTPHAQKVRRSERELQTKAKLLEDGRALIQVEAQRRLELSDTLTRLGECEAAKENHLAEFGTRKTELLTQKTCFQEEMDAQKASLSVMLREQDELEDVERSITRAWDAAVAEREDVEMTLQLAGNGAQLEALAHKIEEQVQSVAKQLRNAGDSAERRNSNNEKEGPGYGRSDEVEGFESESGGTST